MDVDAADISQAKSGVDEAASAAQSALSDGLQSNIDLSNSSEGFTVSQPFAIELFCGSNRAYSNNAYFDAIQFRGGPHYVVHPKSRVIQLISLIFWRSQIKNWCENGLYVTRVFGYTSAFPAGRQAEPVTFA